MLWDWVRQCTCIALMLYLLCWLCENFEEKWVMGSNDRTTVTDPNCIRNVGHFQDWGNEVLCTEENVRIEYAWVCIWYTMFLSSKVNETRDTFGLFYLKILRRFGAPAFGASTALRSISPLSSNATHWNEGLLSLAYASNNKFCVEVLQGD